MFFVIANVLMNNEIIGFRMFEPITESVVNVTCADAYDMISVNRAAIFGLSIKDGKLEMSKMIRRIACMGIGEETLVRKGCTLTLLEAIKLSDKVTEYKLCDFSGKIVKSRNIREYMQNGAISNCEIVRDTNGVKFYYVYKATIDQYNAKLSSLERSYQRYLATSSILGLNVQFLFEINRGHTVITGIYSVSSRLIIPNFVEAINCRRTVPCNDIQLGNGLKYIGNGSIRCNLDREEKIELPKGIRFIGASALKDIFPNDKEVFNADSMYQYGHEYSYCNPNDAYYWFYNGEKYYVERKG